MKRILFINTYYDKFLNSQPLSATSSYTENLQKRISSRFGDSDFYSFWLNKLGWEAVDIIANDQFLQQQWCQENNIATNNLLEICMFQVILFKPSIVYFQDISLITDDVSNFLRAHSIRVCGQHASPLSPGFNFKNLDLFASSMPHLMDVANANGGQALYLPLAFDHRILSELAPLSWDARADGGFVGGFTQSHTNGVELILSALKAFPDLNLYGYGWDESLVALLNGIPWKGEAWGLSMFNLLGGWKISLNRHIDMSGVHANNMRLYETTGMGALLLTDKKQKNNLFVPDLEMVEYENIYDLKEKILYLNSNPLKAMEIAARGQKKTLEHHTYQLRMAELSKALESL